jgi:HrpA-like RNA helicase
MSATINHLTFTTYFGNAPLLEIQGRTFPVADHYLEDIVSSLSYRPQGGSGGGGGGAGGKQKQSKEQQEAIRAEYESMGLTGGSIQLLDSIVKADRVEAGLVAAVVQHAVSKAEDKGGVLVFCPGPSPSVHFSPRLRLFVKLSS